MELIQSWKKTWPFDKVSGENVAVEACLTAPSKWQMMETGCGPHSNRMFLGSRNIQWVCGGINRAGIEIANWTDTCSIAPSSRRRMHSMNR